jgi:hypothetical protein
MAVSMNKMDIKGLGYGFHQILMEPFKKLA